MAESLVGKIVSNAGKQWNRNTVADGTWLNTNTIQKFNENDKTLAEAIESVSAAMEHFTPEITPSAWSCTANQTIQTIEQNADGSLNVTYQSIETSTTSDDSLWSLYQQNAYDPVLAAYTETYNDINHISGELSESLTIPAGIYDVKVEVLYEPTQSTINNKLDIAISKSTDIADALYQTFILFDDSLINDTTSTPQKIDVQSQWITGIIKLTESTTLKFLIKGESAQGRYKLNNIYINSIIGVKGDKGDQGSPGTPGADGADGKSVELSANPLNAHLNWRLEGDTNWTDTGYAVSGEVGPRGSDGISPTVSTEQIPGGNRVTFTYDDGTETPATEYIDVMSGVSGEPGHTPVISMTATDISRESQGQTQNGTEVKFTIDGTDTTYSAWNGLNGSGSMSQVYTAGYVEGTGVDQEQAVQLTQEAVDAIEAVSGKVSPAIEDENDDYFVWKYSDQPSAPSGWTSLKIAGANEGWINPSDLDSILKPENGLSGKWVGGNTQEYQFGLSAEYENNIKAVPNKIDKTQLKIDDTINEIKYTNGNSSSAISAVNYKEGHTGWNAQQLFVVNGDSELISLVNGGACDNKGSIFFVVSGHQ